MRKRILEFISGILVFIGFYLTEPQTMGGVVGITFQNSTMGILLIISAAVIFVIAENGKK